MFERLGRLVSRLRFVIVAAWTAAAIGALLFAPSLASVGKADQSAFLPAGIESVEAQAALDRAFPGEASAGTATIAFTRSGGLTVADQAYIDATAAWLSQGAPAGVTSVVKNVLGIADHPELAALLTSADGEVQLLQVELSVSAFQPPASAAVTAIREHLSTSTPAGLQANVTGSVGIAADYLDNIFRATDRTTVVTIVLVVCVLLLIYRAPLAAFVPLATIGAAYLVASGLLGYLAQAGWQISSLMQTFVVVLVFGVGTDYTIFLISRHREEVARLGWADAIPATLGRIGTVITASAATVVVGLGSMVVGRFVMFQSTGPALAIAILTTLAAGLTLAPALLAIFGRRVFWPLRESNLGVDPERGLFARLARSIARRPGLVSVAVLIVLVVPALSVGGMRQNFDVLADLPAGSDGKAGYEAVAAHFDKGQLLPTVAVIQAANGSDLTAPAALAGLKAATDALLATPGVQRARSLIAPAGDGSVPVAFRPSAELSAIASGLVAPSDPSSAMAKLLDPATTSRLVAASDYVRTLGTGYPDVSASAGYQATATDLARLPAAIAEYRAADQAQQMSLLLEIGALAKRIPGELGSLAGVFAVRADDLFIPRGLAGELGVTVERALAAYVAPDGSVERVYVIATDDAYSAGAFATVARVRTTLEPLAAGFGSGTTILVGGPTAQQVDLQATINEDFLRVATLTVIGVFLVLVLLLRSIVAPAYLVASVLLSYLATLGLGQWFFQDVLGQPGLNYFLPLMVFVLLVALGSDYNIFLMSRIREEAAVSGTREGIRTASARTGAVITSAGVILAGTFLAMVVSPLTVLQQVGAAVAVGVLIDTFIVRSLLVPAVTTRLGDLAWWPSIGRAGRPSTGPGRPSIRSRPAHRTT